MAEDQWKRTGERFLLWQGSQLTVAGIPFRIPVVKDYVRPVLLTSETPEVTVSVEQECERLHILGQVTFPVGYPVGGTPGEKWRRTGCGTVADGSAWCRSGTELKLRIQPNPGGHTDLSCGD